MNISSIFGFRKKSLKLAEPTTTLKGQYLGNVSTNVAKGEKCVDRPLALLWNNYVKTAGKQTVAMKITADNNGLKVYTTNQGLTHYWCHRISHFCVAKTDPKLFVWIYRHVGKKLKVELRCHAILLSSDKKAKNLVDFLTEKVAASLQEYRREKTLKHRRRLLDEKAAAHLAQHGEGSAQARTKLLATSKNYKPPTEYSLASPTLTAISEEADCSSSEESDYNTGSPYSTLGRWTFKNKFNQSDSSPSTPDVNMNQLPNDNEYDPRDFSDIVGFATLPKHRPHSKRKMQKKLLVDRLETLVMQGSSLLEDGMSDSEDDYEVEATIDDEDDEDSGAGSQSLSGAEVSPVIDRLSSSDKPLDKVSCTTSAVTNEIDEGSVGSLSDVEEDVALRDRAPPSPLIRSFSDGFYSFDKSSLSSDCSEVSIEKQKVFRHSKNHVSSESGVGEDIGSTEALSKSENDIPSNLNKFDNIKNILSSNIEEKVQSTDQIPIILSTTPPQKLSQLNDCIFYQPPKASKVGMQENDTTSNSDANSAMLTHTKSSGFNCNDGSDSDSSDSSIEIIRIITRL